MVWTYTSNDTAKGSWAPRWLSGGRGGTNNLAVNTGINAGLELFVRNATNGLQSYISQWNQISSLRDSLRPFSVNEFNLFAAAKSNVDDKFREAEEAVEKSRQALDEAVAKAAHEPLFASGLSLTNAQRNFRDALTSSAGAALGRIRAINDAALAANKDYPLFKEIKARLDEVQARLSDRVAELLASGDAKEFQTLDETCLADNAFRKRADLYASAKKLLDEDPFAGAKLIGFKGDQLEKYLNERVAPIRNEVGLYAGKLSNDVAAAVAYELKLVERKQSERFFDAYLNQGLALTSFGTGFPLTRDLNHRISAEAFSSAWKQLKFISEDLVSSNFQKYAPRDSAKWKSFVGSVADQQAITKALMGEEGILGSCSISLAANADSTRTDDEWQGTWRDLKVIFDGGPAEATRTGFDTDQKMADVPVQQKFELRQIKNVNTPDSPTAKVIQTGDWGPLELLHKYKGERDKADPKTWLVRIPVTAPGAKGWIRLKLKFEGALPELDKWPTS